MTNGREPAAGVDLARLLGRDYWLVRSIPRPGTDQTAIEACVQEHVAWLLDLERRDLLLASGPLLSGPGTGPGSGVTILRAPDEETARTIADGVPFFALLDPCGLGLTFEDIAMKIYGRPNFRYSPGTEVLVNFSADAIRRIGGRLVKEPKGAVGFKSGQRVKHPKYGEGVVFRREGDGEDAKITVQFTRFGVKKLVEKFAQLERL